VIEPAAQVIVEPLAASAAANDYFEPLASSEIVVIEYHN
jgi:hypothetical protein